jgi:anti-sigma regulatory factor (Ser/Thr protein kinase)
MPTRDLSFRFPASLVYLTPLRQLVEAFCTDVLQSETHAEQIYQLQLAVSELATNIIRHAYRDVEAGAIEMSAVGADTLVTLDFLDTGKPYTMTTPKLPDVDRLAEGGYGSFIIQQCVDRVTYDRDDAVHNHWHLEKQFGK